MPICKKCNKEFPNWKIINQEKKNLSKRKYCLVCSPYKKHNTKKLHISIDISKPLKCSMCNRKYIYNRKSGHTLTKCNSCVVITSRGNLKEKAIKQAVLRSIEAIDSGSENYGQVREHIESALTKTIKFDLGLDYLYDVEENLEIEFLLNKIDDCLNEEYLDMDMASEGLVAVELFAAANGKRSSDFSSNEKVIIFINKHFK